MIKILKVILGSWVLILSAPGCLTGGGGGAGVPGAVSSAVVPRGMTEAAGAPGASTDTTEGKVSDAAGAIDPRAEIERIKTTIALYERSEANTGGLNQTISSTSPEGVMIFQPDVTREVRFLIKLIYLNDMGAEIVIPPSGDCPGQARLVYSPMDDETPGAKRYFDTNVLAPPYDPDPSAPPVPNAFFQVKMAETGRLKLYYSRKTGAGGVCLKPADTGEEGQPFVSEADWNAFQADTDFLFVGTVHTVFPPEWIYRMQDNIEGIKPLIPAPKLPFIR